MTAKRSKSSSCCSCGPSAVGTLQNNVNRVLETPGFLQALRAQGIELARTAQPKQTGTTRRWRLGLRLLESDAEIPTKIEFSRRGLGSQTAVEPVDPEIIRKYRLYPVIVQHYGARAAFAQKVTSLALRDHVQSRDVFDLKLLLDAGGASQPILPTATKHLAAAIENGLAVDYDDFAGQALAYLEPQYQDYYGNKKAWNNLREQVVSALESLQP